MSFGEIYNTLLKDTPEFKKNRTYFLFMYCKILYNSVCFLNVDFLSEEDRQKHIKIIDILKISALFDDYPKLRSNIDIISKISDLFQIATNESDTIRENFGKDAADTVEILNKAISKNKDYFSTKINESMGKVEGKNPEDLFKEAIQNMPTIKKDFADIWANVTQEDNVDPDEVD